MSKTCIQCREEKPLEQFSKCSRNKDGLQTACKACNKINNAKFRQTKPEYQKGYWGTPKGAENRYKASQKFFDRKGAGIYIIKNKVTGKIYVGKSTQLQRREQEWRMYLNNLNTDHSRKMIGNDVEKYGVEAFEMIIIEQIENPTKELLSKRERYYVKLFRKVGEIYNTQWNTRNDERMTKWGHREHI